IFNDDIDRDVFGYAVDKGWMCVQVFFVRQGKLIEREVSLFPHYHDPEEDFLSFVTQFYHETPALPREIHLPLGADTEWLGQWLKDVHVHVPQRGLKKKRVDMATENARIALEERFRLRERDEERTIQAARRLGKCWGSERPGASRPSTTPTSRGPIPCRRWWFFSTESRRSRSIGNIKSAPSPNRMMWRRCGR